MVGESIIDPAPGGITARGRRFGVYDSMVLIGGIAFLIAYAGHDLRNLAQQIISLGQLLATYFGLISSKTPLHFLLNWIEIAWSTVMWYGVQASERLILIMTPVLLLLRLGRPRPTIRAMLKQPGAVAGLAVIFGAIWVAGLLHYFFFGRVSDGTVIPIAVGSSVTVAWAGLAMGRWWEPEPSWIDRMGRLLGASAIAVGSMALWVFGI